MSVVRIVSLAFRPFAVLLLVQSGVALPAIRLYGMHCFWVWKSIMSADAVLLVSFGGPEGMDDVMPFLENVLRGKNVPHSRKLQVAEHYGQFGGVSPINRQNRALIDALKVECEVHDIRLPIYFGNRNWHPFSSRYTRADA